MNTPIRMDYVANDTEVIAAFKRQQKELEAERKKRKELEDQIAAGTKATKESEKAAREAAKAAEEAAAVQAKAAAEAAKIIAANRTETERHADEVQRLWELKEKGLLTEAQYNRALAASSQSLNSSAAAQSAAARSADEHNQQLSEAKRIIESLKTPEERHQERLKMLDDLRKKGMLSAEQHAAATKKEGEAFGGNAKAADSFGSQVRGVATSLGTMVVGFASMQTVIEQLRSEYDALIERQNKSANANVTLATAQESLIENLGGENAQKLFGRVRQLSKSTGIDEAKLTSAMNETLAARGDMSLDQVFEAVQTTSQVKRLDAGALPVMSGAVLDVQKQTGMDATQSLGFLMQLQSQSRIKSMGALAENATPAIGSVMEFGADRQTAAAMVAALSHGMGDTTGAQSKTSAIQLAKQLEAFGGAGSNIAETIQTIQGDRAVYDEFMKNATFEAAALPAVRSLLGGGRQAQQFASARAAFGADPTGAVQAAVDARGASTAIGLAEQQQQMKNALNQLQLEDTVGAESAISREGLKEIRQQLGRAGVATQVLGLMEDGFSGGVQNKESAIAGMRSEVERLREGGTDLGYLSSFGPFAVMGALLKQNANQRDPETKRAADLLEKMISLMEGSEDRKAQANAGVVAGNRAIAQREK